MAKELDVPEVEINFLCSEHLYARDFAEFDPIPTLNSVKAGPGLNDDKDLRDLHNIPEGIKIVNNWRNYDFIQSRWLEELGDCHERAIMIKRNFAQRLADLKG